MHSSARQTESRPIFVAGAPRSGTTLCAAILNRHPDLFATGETHFMEDILSRRQEIGDLREAESRRRLVERLSTIYARFNEPEAQERVDRILEAEANIESLLEGATSMGSAFSTFMQLQAHAVSKDRWVNHTPKDVFYVDELSALFPNSQFIFCIRDPIDFLFSYQMKWRATSEREVDRIKSLYHPIMTSLLWKASAKRIVSATRALDQDRIHILRYEDLVSDPENSVRSICEFLQESFNTSMCSIDFSNSSFSNETGGITQSSIGRGRRSIAAEDAWWAERICGDEMRRFGYDAVATRPAIGSKVRVAASFPFKAVRAVFLNRRKTGPLVPYVFRRIRGLLKSS